MLLVDARAHGQSEGKFIGFGCKDRYDALKWIDWMIKKAGNGIRIVLMGNSMGGLGAYMKLIDKYDMYHGGFIWDFIDQAIMVKDSVTGKDVLRYGGDFDDKPADYEFSANGIVFADRKEKPAMQEVRYYYGLYR